MRKSYYYAILIAFLFLTGSSTKESYKSKQGGRFDERIEALIVQMTLEEKIGQLSQFDPRSFSSTEEMKTAIRKGEVGSFLNIVGSLTDELQRVAVEESRLGIPILFGRDVIHGYKTIFPIPLGQSCSWNPELIEKAARYAAIEASSEGIRWTFAPMIDITRDPRWGRIAETCGEDPILTSILGASMVRGFQGADLSDPGSIAACAKHYVGYGAAEGGRDYNTTFIPEQQLREVFLPPFKSAVDAGVQTFMSAFNDLNGIPASGNKFTLRKILKGEWKVDGFVVSDWESMSQMIPHGYCSDEKEVAEKSLSAGVDMEMVSTCYAEYLPELVKENKVDILVIDEAVRNILRVKFRLGLFDNPYTSKSADKTLLAQEHLKTARELSKESIVMLKNEDNFIVIYGDILTNQPLEPLINLHSRNNAYATLLLHKRKESNSYIELNRDARITCFKERPNENELQIIRAKSPNGFLVN